MKSCITKLIRKMSVHVDEMLHGLKFRNDMYLVKTTDEGQRYRFHKFGRSTDTGEFVHIEVVVTIGKKK